MDPPTPRVFKLGTMALGSRENWEDQGMEEGQDTSLAEGSPGGEKVLRGGRRTVRETAVLCLEVACDGEIKLDMSRRPPTHRTLIYLQV